MKETKTVKAGSDCPTLLHYLAKVLMRMDASLVMFIEDLPHVEAAGRGNDITVICMLILTISSFRAISSFFCKLALSRLGARQRRGHNPESNYLTGSVGSIYQHYGTVCNESSAIRGRLAGFDSGIGDGTT